jgi:hypothetical protein
MKTVWDTLTRKTRHKKHPTAYDNYVQRLFLKNAENPKNFAFWLQVPYKDKTMARIYGAWWEPTRKCWYARQDSNLACLERWRAPAGFKPPHVTST